MYRVTFIDREGTYGLPKAFKTVNQAIAGAAREMLTNRGAYEFPVKVRVMDDAGKVVSESEWQKPEILGRQE